MKYARVCGAVFVASFSIKEKSLDYKNRFKMWKIAKIFKFVLQAATDFLDCN